MFICGFCLPNPAGAQGPTDERVYRSLTTEQLEDMLAAEKIQFKKTESTTSRGTYFYDFKRAHFKLRLTYFEGKDLMLDNFFGKAIPFDKVNAWNKKVKFSRASLHKDKEGEFLMLEYNLDVQGGITRGTVKQFISRFEQECSNFDRFIGTAVTNTDPPLADDQTIHNPVTSAIVEQVLKNQKLDFQKKTIASGDVYDFKMDGFALRLVNFNGKDLMIDAAFRKTSLAALNKYNVDRKFVRAVHYNTNGNEFTALESNLDCAAGVTSEMLRHFVTAFLADVRHFSEYLGKQPQGER